MIKDQNYAKIREYSTQRHKEGFSCQDIEEKLSSGGYPSELVCQADRSYHLHRRISLGALIASIILVMYIAYHLLGGSGTQQLHPKIDCNILNLPDQEACVNERLSESDPTMIVHLAQSYNTTTTLAISQDNPSVCETLPYLFMAERCKATTALRKALKTGDPKTCEGITDQMTKEYCLIAVLQAAKDVSTPGIL